MPELPEVETVRRTIAPRIQGRTIARARLILPRILELGSRQGFARLKGLEVRELDRIGKYLLVRLGEAGPRSRTLVVHLGMTGSLMYQAQGQLVTGRFVKMASGYMKSDGPHTVDKHTHAVFELEGGGRFMFRDPRTFGKLLLMKTADEATTPRLAKLGPDAWGVSGAEFGARFRSRRGKRQVKSVLLDQSFLAGIGNIYADEACFEAGVKPQARAARLGPARVERLAAAVQAALARGLENCGTSFSDFVAADGSEGSNQEDLRVYGRGGLPCVTCGAELKKGVVAQRGTVWCPRCQRA